MFVNFDLTSRGKKLGTQLRLAKDLFARYEGQAHCFLVKPEGRRDAYLEATIASLIRCTSELAGIDVVGMTEKDLGDSVLDRMVSIAKLRRGLDSSSGVRPCLQVFGALDPLSSCLYFLAGADIFDGLTWLRYAYADGQCLYAQNRGVERPGIHVKDALVKSSILSENYYYLLNLQYAMRKFLLANDYSVFGRNANILRDAASALATRLDGR